MTSPPGTRQRGVAAAALGLAAFATLGCAFRTADLPDPEVRPATRERIFVLVDRTAFGYPAAAEAYWRIAAGLAADLEDAGFRPAVILDRDLAPDGEPLIEEIDPGGECFAEPMLTVLTVGVIPHVGCQEYGHRFTLRRSKHEPQREVDAHFTVRAFWGWLTWPAALLPSYSYDLRQEVIRDHGIRLLRKEVQDALRHG